MKDQFLIVNQFRRGWQQKEDETKIPVGALRNSRNITITDRGGIAPRPQEELVGTAEASTSTGVRALYSFKKSDGNDILIKAFDDKIKYYNEKSGDWCLLKSGYLSADFGFKEMQVSVDATDWLYFGNGTDPYSRWCGYQAKLVGALAGGETEVIVDSVLKESVIYEGTASACSATTIDIATSDWATDIWNDYFVVRITSGAKEGYIGIISDTTSTRITFNSISGLSGTPTFEIRQLAVPATGTLVYADTELEYTGIPRDDRFTVSSAHAGADGIGLTVVPIEYPDLPRGNLLETTNANMYVAGSLYAPNTVYRSAVAGATDYSFSSPRVAGEGDVCYFPYNGRKITALIAQEGYLYVIKPHSIEALSYPSTEDDLAQFDPIKRGVNIGSAGKVWRLDDDVMFATESNKITTLGRIANKDTTPQTTDLAYDIRRGIKNFVFDQSCGDESDNRVYVAARSSSAVSYNDKLLVYNKDFKCWEGIWLISAGSICQHDGKIYYGDSYNGNVYKVGSVLNKTSGSNTFPMTAFGATGWINKNGTGFYLNEISCVAVEGYITSGSTIEINLYKDFASEAFQELVISGQDDTDMQDGLPTFSMLGGNVGGLEPLGASIIGDEDEDGRRHFIAFLNFPTTPIEYISVEVGSSGKNQDWEVIAIGLNTTDTVYEAQNRIKN